MRTYDVVIIGAGMSGLAAGIRLAHYGWKVAIMERHSRIGGMNSWYCRNGREFDVGLHAMTNFQPPGKRTSPLGKILKQLRLRYHELDLVEQNYSLIKFPEAELRFTNDFRQLEAGIADLFPAQMDGMNKLRQRINDFNSLSLHPRRVSTREVMRECITDPLLQEMLLCPIMYYGNADEEDMDFAAFCVMFQSIFQEGLCRPRRGIRPLLELLADRYRQAGGELYLQNGVKSIVSDDRRISAVELDSGEKVRVNAVLSSAGFLETMQLCRRTQPLEKKAAQKGSMSFVEAIFVLDQPTEKIFGDATIVFKVSSRPFQYRCPDGLIEPGSEVICFPDNFKSADPEWVKRGEARVRLTRIADPGKWAELRNTNGYQNAKQQVRDLLWQTVRSDYQIGAGHLAAEDLFTPCTLERYTGRLHGAVYGIPEKRRDGCTPLENLFICGTDQGFLGITGAMLSGVSMVNYHFFASRKTA